MSDPEEFDLIAIGRALTGTRFARHLQHFASVGSTNTLLLAAAAEGASEGTVYVADEQTAGRGRGGHEWHSAAGDGLYVSALIRLPLPLQEALLVSLAAGLAAQQAIRQVAAINADIRWPNDILIGPRKCGGILVESAVEGEMMRHAVIGIGININHIELPPDIAAIATSLRIEAGHSISRTEILVELLRSLDLELTRLEEGRDDLLNRFAAASTWVRGKRVHVSEAGGYTGVTDGIDPHGFLQVTDDDGVRHKVLSGGVREA